MLISCRANVGRWNRIREGWLDASGFPFVIIVGATNNIEEYDESTHVLSVPCDDTYDALPVKVALALRAVRDRFHPEFVLKIDDDVVASPTILASLLGHSHGIPDHVQYGGCVVQINSMTNHGGSKFTSQKRTPIHVRATYCGGPAYYLGAKALDILAAHMTSGVMNDVRFEDVLVGLTLQRHGILPVSLALYTDHKPFFDAGRVAAWHDSKHVSSQNMRVCTAEKAA